MMKKIILFLLPMMSFAMTAQTTLTINSVSVTEVDPVTRGGTFNFEVKYQADAPVTARLQFWFSYFNKGEYDAWFINESRGVVEVSKCEENVEKTAKIAIKFPSEPVIKEYSPNGVSPNGVGEHNEFKVVPTSKLQEGEEYQIRIFVGAGNKIVNATQSDSTINIDRIHLQKGKGVTFFAIPNFIDVQ